LVCGSAGCGKTSLGIEFLVRATATVRRGGCLFVVRGNCWRTLANVASLGFDLDALIGKEKLAIDHVW
jgi:circadian clock protein KaiC